MSLFKDNFIYRGYDVRERVTDYSIHKGGEHVATASSADNAREWIDMKRKQELDKDKDE